MKFLKIPQHLKNNKYFKNKEKLCMEAATVVIGRDVVIEIETRLEAETAK